MLSGFTIVRNAVKLEYPIVPAIRSILDICDEVVVNVGRSEDGTRDLVAAIRDPRVRIIDSVWDLSQGSAVLAEQTNRAMRACRSRWGVYIQADEVLHESGAALLADRVREWDADRRVEGLLVDYLHFYGDFGTVATSRRWYRREVRCVRLDRDIHSFQDAQGFRVGDEQRRVRARVTGARIFHYGWARPARAIREKYEMAKTIYPWSRERSVREQQKGYLDWLPLLKPFTGTHPRAAQDWLAARARETVRSIGPRHLKLEHLRFYVSDWIERLVGARLFEFRNYELV